MNVRLTIDRFEGDRKQIAVLLTDDGTQINFPKNSLPKGVRAGDILTLTGSLAAALVCGYVTPLL